MVVLGIDPGSLATGWGVLEGEGARTQVVDYGVLRTPKGALLPKRLAAIHDGLGEVFVKHRPASCALESLFYSKNIQTAFVIGEARGVALLASEKAGVPVFEYAPAEVKQAVTGRGQASKAQVGYMIRRLLALPEDPPEDACDALAIALCHLTRGKARRRMSKAR